MVAPDNGDMGAVFAPDEPAMGIDVAKAGRAKDGCGMGDPDTTSTVSRGVMGTNESGRRGDKFLQPGRTC